MWHTWASHIPSSNKHWIVIVIESFKDVMSVVAVNVYNSWRSLTDADVDHSMSTSTTGACCHLQ